MNCKEDLSTIWVDRDKINSGKKDANIQGIVNNTEYTYAFALENANEIVREESKGARVCVESERNNLVGSPVNTPIKSQLPSVNIQSRSQNIVKRSHIIKEVYHSNQINVGKKRNLDKQVKRNNSPQIRQPLGNNGNPRQISEGSGNLLSKRINVEDGKMIELLFKENNKLGKFKRKEFRRFLKIHCREHGKSSEVDWEILYGEALTAIQSGAMCTVCRMLKRKALINDCWHGKSNLIRGMMLVNKAAAGLDENWYDEVGGVTKYDLIKDVHSEINQEKIKFKYSGNKESSIESKKRPRGLNQISTGGGMDSKVIPRTIKQSVRGNKLVPYKQQSAHPSKQNGRRKGLLYRVPLKVETQEKEVIELNLMEKGKTHKKEFKSRKTGNSIVRKNSYKKEPKQRDYISKEMREYSQRKVNGKTTTESTRNSKKVKNIKEQCWVVSTQGYTETKAVKEIKEGYGKEVNKELQKKHFRSEMDVAIEKVRRIMKKENVPCNLEIIKRMETQCKEERRKTKRRFKKMARVAKRSEQQSVNIVFASERKTKKMVVAKDGYGLEEMKESSPGEEYICLSEYRNGKENIQVFGKKENMEEFYLNLREEESKNNNLDSERNKRAQKEDERQERDKDDLLIQQLLIEKISALEKEEEVLSVDISKDEEIIQNLRNRSTDIPLIMEEDVEIEPRTQVIMNIGINHPEIRKEQGKEMLVVPKQIYCGAEERNNIGVIEGVSRISPQGRIVIAISNHYKNKVLIKKGTLLAKLVDIEQHGLHCNTKRLRKKPRSERGKKELAKSIVERMISAEAEEFLNNVNIEKMEKSTVKEKEVEDFAEITSEEAKVQNEDMLNKYKWLAEIMRGPLTPVQTNKVLKLCIKYSEIWSTHKMDLGNTPVIKHKIELDDDTPVNIRNYTIDPKKRKIRDEKINELYKAGIIERSTSSWNSPCLLIGKSDGDYRLVVDFRKVNEHIKQHIFPLPALPDFLEKLAENSIFSNFDLTSGFNQIELDKESRHITAFSSSYDHFQHKMLPQGLINSPPTFQRMMNIVLGTMIGVKALCFIDDIFVFAPNFEKHLEALEELFQRLRRANLKLKPKKSYLGHRVLKFLGHIISSEGVLADPSKCDKIVNWPRPKTAKHIKSFLGLASYFRSSIEKFAEIAKPLYTLASKEKAINTTNWKEEHEWAFNRLKKALASPEVMATPDWNKPFWLFTDASNKAIGGVLSQIHEGKEKVVEYFSKGLTAQQQEWSVTDKELLALKDSMEHFAKYLKAGRFKAVVDHAALLYMSNMPTLRDKHWRMFESIKSFDYKLEYRPGKKHVSCDALSRNPIYQNIPQQDKYCNLSTNLLARVEIEKDEVKKFKNTALNAMAIKIKDEVTAIAEYTVGEYRSYNPDSLYEQVSLALTNRKDHKNKVREALAKLEKENIKFFKDYIMDEDVDPDKHIKGVKKHEAATRVELEALASMLQIIIAIKGNYDTENKEGEKPRIRDEIFLPQIASKKKIQIPNGLIMEFEVDKHGNYVFTNYDLHIRENNVNEIMDKTYRRQRASEEVSEAEPLYVKKNPHKSRFGGKPGIEAKEFLDKNKYKDLEIEHDEVIMWSNMVQEEIELLVATTRQSVNRHKDIYEGAKEGLELINIKGEENPNLSAEEMRKFQENDEFCNRIIESLEEKDGGTINKKLLERAFISKEGVLRIYPSEKRGSSMAKQRMAGMSRIALPETLYKTVFQVYHEKMAHLGIAKGVALLGRDYYGHDMIKKFKEYVSECITCRNKTGNKNRRKNKMEIRKMPVEPMEHVAFDILGPLTETTEGNKYILNIVDIYSRFLAAIPLPNKSAKTVANAIMKNWILKFGLPGKMTSDNAKEFIGKLMTAMCIGLEIKRELTPIYTPQWNSHSEKQNHMLGNALRTMGNEEHDDWDTLLPYICFAYNATPNTSTGEAPHYVIYGRDAKLPSSPFVGEWEVKDEEYLTPTQYGTNLAKRMKACQKLYKQHMDNMQKKNIEQVNKNRKEHNLKEGDLVTATTPMPANKGLCRKLYKTIAGPFRIEKIAKRVAWIRPLTQPHAESTEIHVDKLEKIILSTRQLLHHWSEIIPEGIRKDRLTVQHKNISNTEK